MRRTSRFYATTVVRSLLAALLAVTIAGATTTSVTTAADELSFNRDIRPILSENCYHCHGPDESALQADLRLDVEERAKRWAIVPGDPESSELVARVLSDDPDTVMPPPDSERSLTEKQRELIRQWVQQGAPYQKHWSFQPPRKPPVPRQGQAWASNAIDRFVYSRLQTRGFDPAPPAARELLLRRITFDLIGLPPTLQELDEYLADLSDEATEKVIDRLLADPRYGERMASDWLDVSRYSDTYGYQVDRDRFVWPWRDWVVDAFNRNLGYDDFVTQQIAGDLLPSASRDQILATTFNRLHPQKVEGGSVPEEFRIEYVSDRTQTFGTAFLGLTLECCRCHSHKYDPISQKEYYQLASLFANIDEAGLYSFFTPAIPTPTLSLPTDDQTRRIAELKQRLQATQRQYDQLSQRPAEVQAFDRQAYWQDVVVESAEPKKEQTGPASSTAGAKSDEQTANAKTQRVDTLFAQPIESKDFDNANTGANQSVEGIRGKAFRLTGDDPVNFKSGNFRRDQPFSISLWIKTPDLKERAVVLHRSRAWTDAASRGYQLLIENGRLSWSLIHFWPGNAMRIKALNPLPIGQWVHVVITNNGSSKASGLGLFINGKIAATEVVRDNLSKNITGGGGDQIAIGQRFRDRGFTGGSVDQCHVFACELTPLEIRRLSSPSEQIAWLQQPLNQWTAERKQLLREHLHLRHNDKLIVLRERLGKERRSLFALEDSLREIMVMRENAPRTSYLLTRGAYDQRAEAVDPGTPSAVGALGQFAPNRLGLTQWMLEKKHPLTSRVAMNRLWQLCFGVGLVRTPEDFGSQGDPPTHPELLDWLAVDFVEHGWDIKRAIKQIMLSSTYQQASEHPNPELWNMDPENRLLARHNAYRLPAEMIRDQSLAIAGQLVARIGGPPVKPYEVEASFKPTKRDSGEGLYRRSLYTYWKRTGPAPAMMTLDAAKRDVCRVRRERTSSPLQAFVLLNGPQYVEAARSVARKLIQKHGDDQEAMLNDAFRILVTRSPSQDELAVLVDLLQSQHKYFAANPDRAAKYLNVGELKIPEDIDPELLAATGVTIGTLMNFDESVMKR